MLTKLVFTLSVLICLTQAFPQQALDHFPAADHQEVEPVFHHAAPEEDIEGHHVVPLHEEEEEQEEEEHHEVEEGIHRSNVKTAAIDHQARGFGGSNVLHVNKDRQAFVDMINSILWDADEEAEVAHAGEDGARQFVHQFRKRGLFGMQMPQMFKDEGTMTGEMYRSAMDTCYGYACEYGLGGLASSLSSLFG